MSLVNIGYRIRLVGHAAASGIRTESSACTGCPMMAVVARQRMHGCNNHVSSSCRHRHDDKSSARKIEERPQPPLPLHVFHRTVAVPPAVIDYLVSKESGRENGKSGQRSYNAVWLRESCRCPQCYNAKTEQRSVVFHQLGPEAFDSMSVVETEDRRLEVLWADGHVSRYKLDELDKAAGSSTGSNGSPSPIAGSSRYSRRLWDSSRMSNVDDQLERVDFCDLVENPPSQTPATAADGSSYKGAASGKSRDALKALLGNLLRHGFSFVDNAPADLESTMSAARMICPPLRTFYGENWSFGVSSTYSDTQSSVDSVTSASSIDIEFSDTAYLNVGIGVHNDGTYWNIPPGIQVLHCIQRDRDGTGGETLLVDGFDAAERLRRADRSSFDLLTRVRLDHQYVEPGKFCYRSSEPILRVFPASGGANAGNGEMEWIRYNPYDRVAVSQASSTGKLSIAEVYVALAGLGRLIDDPRAAIRFHLRPGRILFVDNWRILHGRTAFSGQRYVCGCYLPRDDWISRAQSLDLLTTA